jgi:hypothetical protein
MNLSIRFLNSTASFTPKRNESGSAIPPTYALRQGFGGQALLIIHSLSIAPNCGKLGLRRNNSKMKASTH